MSSKITPAFPEEAHDDECPCEECCNHADTEFGLCVYCGFNVRENMLADHADSTRE